MNAIEKLFRIASADVCCNTSYPISPRYFFDYRASGFDIMEGVPNLSFYFHIPFCRSLCRFCEYTRVKSGNADEENRYVDLLERQTAAWLARHSFGRVEGLDVGGGTPTSLNRDAFARVMRIASQIGKARRDAFLEPSVEFSYATIDEEKVSAIGAAGFTRASTGLQIVDEEFLKGMERPSSELARMQMVNDWLKAVGVGKINLDIMYGFEGKDAGCYDPTLRVVDLLRPEQVTLYEVRYNMNAMSHVGITRETNFELYSRLYERLAGMGYHARFGQNSFSVADDEGVSSYLRRRMFGGVPYKGFGISAQSMSQTGLAYNSLKGYCGERFPRIGEITEADTYRLPGDELAAKYVAVSLYGGKFQLPVVSRFLGCSALDHFSKEMDFLVSGDYLTVTEDGVCQITPKGFREYGAVAALFWSDLHKRLWLEDKEG